MRTRCRHCHSDTFLDKVVQHVVEVDGRVFTGGIRALECDACEAVELDPTSLRQFELVSACRLADSGARSGSACRFIRKALGLARADVADLLDVPLAAIVRWERGDENAPRMVVGLLGCFAHDRLNGRDATVDRLRTIGLVTSASSMRSGPPATRYSRPAEPDAEDRGPVLVVEDEHEIRSAVQELLEGEGYQVFVAENGHQALDLLATMPAPRVIVMDLLMPVMNGWELLQMLKKDSRFAGIPIVVLSAVADFSPGPEPARFVRKPLDVDSLLSAVHELAA
jgi:CheY-like chemotaxis protein/DNA-binding transcriptional regulator YiaG